MFKPIFVITLVLLAASSVFASEQETAPQAAKEKQIRLAALYLDWVLSDVQSSTKALAKELEYAHASTPTPNQQQQRLWLSNAQHGRHTVLFHNWAATSRAPGYQSPAAAFLSYGDDQPDVEKMRTLAMFQQLVPALRSAYSTFDFSWTYITTANDMMALYPFLSLEEAVNNYPPTKQVFYTAANFQDKQAGWTKPYLDLAGDGMMVTVSHPASRKGRAIGVASHDITLAQLSQQVLSNLATKPNQIAYIVDKDGLVIGVSDQAMSNEMKTINETAGAAALHYRTNTQKAEWKTTQTTPWVNNVTEKLLSRFAATNTKVASVTLGNYNAIAARTATPEWVLVLVDKK